MLAHHRTVAVSMARHQEAPYLGRARPPLRHVKRQLAEDADDKRAERGPKRHLRNQSVDIRRSRPCSRRSSGGSLLAGVPHANQTSSSRARKEGTPTQTTGSVCNWSEMATVSSEEGFMDDIPSFSRAMSRTAALDLCEDNAPPGHRLLERTRSDLSYTGSWTDEDSSSTCDHNLEVDNWSCSRPPKVPHAPHLGKLTTPHLSPMPSMFEFCYCCSDDEKESWEDDRINDSWRLSRRDKVDAQLDWAMAYMEQRRRGVEQ